MKRKNSEKQLSLPGLNRKTGNQAYGGDHTKGKRKTRRPFDPKQALHVVLRSSKARGQLSMLHPRHCNHVQGLVDRLQKRWKVAVYRYANVGNHLHLLVRARTRLDWQGFIRELAGGIAMLVTGARKGMALKRPQPVSGVRKGMALKRFQPVSGARKADAFKRSREPSHPESAKRGFWDHLVYTRIVAWGRDFTGVSRYVSTNLWEGLGVPVRKLLARGFRVLEISEDGGVFVCGNASAEVLAALKAG